MKVSVKNNNDLLQLVEEVDRRMAVFAGSSNRMSEDRWAEQFQPIENPETESLLFDPFERKDAVVLDATADSFVWTQIDWEDVFDEHDDGSGRAIVPGRLPMDGNGFYITKNPWTSAHHDLVVIID